jgi:hypothetical protein
MTEKLLEHTFLPPHPETWLPIIRKITTVSPQWRHYRVQYLLGESDSGLFGGNSNLGGPVWIPADYLLVETMRSFHHFYADRLKIKCPTGSRIMVDDAGD